MKKGFMERAEAVVFPTGILALYLVPAIWTYQIWHWLKWGRWLPIPLADGLQWIGLREPSPHWMVGRKALHWLFQVPLSIALGVSILGAMLAFGEAADRASISRLRAQLDRLRRGGPERR